MPTYLTEPRYGIRYPAPGAALPDYEAYLQALADDVGTKTAGYSSGTNGAKPTPAVEGRVYRTTDSGGALELDTGTLWLPLSKSVVVRTAGASQFSGQAIVYTGTGAATMALPAPSLGAEVEYWAGSGVSGAAPLTIDAGSGVLIIGKGVSARTIVLGIEGAFVRLRADGTNWEIVGGEQNSGWIAVAGASGVTAGTGYTPAYRLKADKVDLCGQLVGSAITTWATGLPHPAQQINWGTFLSPTMTLSTGGVLTTGTAGSVLNLDALPPYRIS